MSTYKLISLLFLVLLSKYSYGQIQNKFFRSDYEFIETSQSFYKIHTIHRNWKDAVRTCAREGATLFYPENKAEAEAVMAYMIKTQPFHWVYIGISDTISKGVFETIDGTPIADVYHNWIPGEPNAGHPEDCAILRRQSDMGDENCANNYPFICKKTLSSLQWNVKCNIPNTDYEYNEQLGRCYKFHLTPMNWTEAYAVCSAEQSYLAVINSQAEADHLVNMTAQAPKDKVTGTYLRGAILLGFQNKGDNGWETIKGTTLDNSGYTRWGNLQPDGVGREKCGSMFYNGHLNDLGCEHKCFFICEHDVDILSSLFDDRFATQMT